MGSRKIARDLVLSCHGADGLCSPEGVVAGRAGLVAANRLPSARGFTVLNEIKDKLKGEIENNPELQQSIKELKEKKESFAARTKQTSEWLYKEVDDLWTETEVTAKKVTTNMKEKFLVATEEVREKIGLRKQDPPTGPNSTGSSTETKDGNQMENGSDSHAFSERLGTSETYYQKFKTNSYATFNKLKEMKIVDLAKKGYDIVKDELTSNPNRRRKMRQAGASAAQPKEVSLRTDIVVVPKTQSAWSKKWETFKDKMRGLPVYKKNSGYSEPVVTKSQEAYCRGHAGALGDK